MNTHQEYYANENHDRYFCHSSSPPPSSVDLYDVCSINYQTWHETDFAEKAATFSYFLDSKQSKCFKSLLIVESVKFSWRVKHFLVCGLLLRDWLLGIREKTFHFDQVFIRVSMNLNHLYFRIWGMKSSREGRFLSRYSKKNIKNCLFAAFLMAQNSPLVLYGHHNKSH